MTPDRPLGPIAQRLLKSVSKLRKQKVVDLAAFSAGKRHAEALQANVISAEKLAELHPLHARYIAVWCLRKRVTEGFEFPEPRGLHLPLSSKTAYRDDE